jgi:hypothetical protein
MRCRFLKTLSIVALSCVAIVAGQSAWANVLANAGFETDAVSGAAPVGGATGWGTFQNAATASAPLDPVRSGIGSLKLTGGGGFGVPGGNQTFPASEGQVWNFEGYMLTPSTLPADATFGLLKIVWSNGANDLPPGQINAGQAGPAANPGIESLPFLNSTSTPNEWVYTQAQGVAPAGTTQVSFFALFVDQSAGVGYFDDLSASIIPEPSCLALAMASALCLGWRRRK